jgi:methylenetetrahydrofolate reductase (NADPH)
MNPVFSCEFFPPRTEAGMQTFRQICIQLQELQPEYYSVTFGAGGSTQDKTFETVVMIQEHIHVPAAPHLSCITADHASIRRLLDDYMLHGVKRIVALRGDRPSGMGGGKLGDFTYARDLVEFIRIHTGDHFYIEVAAYPEVHPQAENATLDLRYFKEKVAAGANSAITQYFYNADAYFRFVDSCTRAGITIPITPGIMPITNYTQLARFSDMCGAEIPRWLRKRLHDFGDDTVALQEFGIDVVCDLCEKLLRGGAPGLHFYTLNRADTTLAIAHRLGLAAKHAADVC